MPIPTVSNALKSTDWNGAETPTAVDVSYREVLADLHARKTSIEHLIVSITALLHNDELPVVVARGRITLHDRIVAAIPAGPLGHKEIIRQLPSENPSSIRTALSRLAKQGRIQRLGWGKYAALNYVSVDGDL